MTEKQYQVAGERREKDVTDFPRAAAIGQVLLGLQFPADKNKIIQPVQNKYSLSKFHWFGSLTIA